VKKIIILTIAFILSMSFFGCSATTVTNLQSHSNISIYKSKEYNISLSYNKDWKQNEEYMNRFEGQDGFFQISAFNGELWEIDEVANHIAAHKLKPYGSNPQISQLSIHGQEARLIMPSGDQPEGFAKQAELIIKYPKSVRIDGNSYSYFILYADKNNIEKIASTIKFIS
jgi:hypothetical protein